MLAWILVPAFANGTPCIPAVDCLAPGEINDLPVCVDGDTLVLPLGPGRFEVNWVLSGACDVVIEGHADGSVLAPLDVGNPLVTVEAGSVSLHNVEIEPHALPTLLISGGALLLERSVVRSVSGTVLQVSGGELTLRDNRFLGGDPDAFFLGGPAVMVETPEPVVVERNRFCDLSSDSALELVDAPDAALRSNHFFNGSGGLSSVVVTGGSFLVAEGNTFSRQNTGAFYVDGGGSLEANGSLVLQSGLVVDGSVGPTLTGFQNLAQETSPGGLDGYLSVVYDLGADVLVDSCDGTLLGDGAYGALGFGCDQATSNNPWCIDADGDGYPAEVDCDDEDGAKHPNAPLSCAHPDADCGLATVDELFYDADGDGYAGTPCEDGLDLPSSRESSDCDDTELAVHHEHPEVCDELDNNCDGFTDEAAGDLYWIDNDGDGFGDDNPGLTAVQSCVPVVGFVTNRDDCRDSDKTVFPEAVEVCNDVDDNCNGEVDEGVRTQWAIDDDQDGYASELGRKSCEPLSNEILWDEDAPLDCAPDDPAVHPGAEEICNGIDDDCDPSTHESEGAALYYPDQDGDGWGAKVSPIASCDPSLLPPVVENNEDCRDTDPSVFPGAVELCDGVDQDCDGVADNLKDSGGTLYYRDADNDGFGDDSDSVRSCIPEPGFVEVPGDCDDARAETHPGALENCNDADDDCDGEVDEKCGWPRQQPVAISLTGGGCTCSSSDPSGLGILALLLGVAGRRR